MKEKKNIDRIFQENFKDFEKDPGEKVWQNIASRLDEKDNKKPVLFPLWWKIGGVAAVLAIILASLLFTNNQETVSPAPGIVTGEPEPSQETPKSTNKTEEFLNRNSETEEAIAGENNQKLQEKAKPNSAKRTSGNYSHQSSELVSNQENRPASSGKNQNRPVVNEKVVLKNSLAGQEGFKKENNSINSQAENKHNLGIAQSSEAAVDTTNTAMAFEEENILAQIEKETKANKEEKELAEINSKRMRLSTFAAPVFYKNLGNGNELSNQLSDNSTSSEVTVSYGFKVAYQVSKKLRLRTGISKVDISKNIQDISYSPSIASSFENLSPLQENINIRDNNSSPSGLPIGGGDRDNSLAAAVFTPGEINQQFGYIEVPVELEFALIDRKFGLNIIGGGSSLFLNNNQVDLLSSGTRTNLGEATNINNTSFSTNIGLGLDYKLTERFSISMEPIFKYQLNTFNNVDNVQPVNFGVYSGLNFRF